MKIDDSIEMKEEVEENINREKINIKSLEKQLKNSKLILSICEKYYREEWGNDE